ncbi:TPA: DUF4145 domain-containing protein [Vibrio diabolicus]|uniref:DUF4145 domain-containing protein n=1 Tax=Vibrio TaxID=662 RepID=UPI00215DDB4F|nr:DUF4145 domain-containing protein [Vibrio sp. HS-50-1]MCS0204225.1 DUF4145 domain-containing protein [Vibrio sp. HS-50-1]
MKPGFLYSEKQVPSYVCPTCSQEDMLPVGEVSNRQSEVRTGGDTRAMLRTDLLCQNDDCGEVGVMVMMGELYSDGEAAPEMLYTPTYVNPAPNIFQLNQKYPRDIRCTLEQVFSLFWIDSSSCGNKLRIAVEELMTYQGIDDHEHNNGVPILNSKGKPKLVMLQERLKRFKKLGKVHGKCGNALESIKWLGNDSSHSGDSVFQNVVFQAIMVFEAVLKQLYLGEDMPKELEFSVRNIDFFHNPNKQELRPKK